MNLVNAARNIKDIVWSPARERFEERNGPALEGVHPIVNSFMPHSMKVHIALNKESAYSNTIIEKGVSSTCSGNITGKEKDSRGCKSSGAKAHGKIVDVEMSNYANTPVALQSEYIDKHPDLDRCTKTLIREFKKNNITPVAGQIIVGDLKCGCATPIDIGARDFDGSTLLIELKATKQTNPAWYSYETGIMKMPFSQFGIGFSCLNLDMIQLLTTKLLTERGSARFTNFKCKLIRVSGNVAMVYDPPEWFHNQNVQNAYYEFLKFRAQNKRRDAIYKSIATHEKQKSILQKHAVKPRKPVQRKGKPLQHTRSDDI